ncbi:MAG: hypothetical protein Q4B70_04245 [Lachnospiraceae bacterium]|nr:hypothetical protein [Lachnospiraceae bacterium]
MNLNQEISHEYDDIKGLSRPVSNHPHMARQDRAKIFSPFAALRGHNDAVKSMEKLRCNKRILTETELEPIQKTLGDLKKKEWVQITWFHYNPGPDGSGGEAEGEYLTARGQVLKIEPAFQRLRLSFDNAVGWVEIAFEDISDMVR